MFQWQLQVGIWHLMMQYVCLFGFFNQKKQQQLGNGPINTKRYTMEAIFDNRLFEFAVSAIVAVDTPTTVSTGTCQRRRLID